MSDGHEDKRLLLRCKGWNGTSIMRFLVRFLGFLFTAGTVVFLVGRGRRRGRDLVFLQGLARLFAASGLRAAGDDARACVRRCAARRVFQGAAALSADPGDAKARHQRVPRGRGQELLRARRHRLHRHGARGRGVCAELRLQPPAAGRVDDHPAGREELPFDQRSVVHPQDQGSLAGDAHRARLFQGPHPRTLSQ